MSATDYIANHYPKDEFSCESDAEEDVFAKLFLFQRARIHIYKD